MGYSKIYKIVFENMEEQNNLSTFYKIEIEQNKEIENVKELLINDSLLLLKKMNY